MSFLSLGIFCVDLPAQSISEATSNELNSSSSGLNYRDSIYRRIIMQGGKSIDCYLSYRIGSSVVLASYQSNVDELHRLDAFLSSTLQDTLVHIRGISITGYGSIDGTYMRNQELSRARSEGFAFYLRRRYPALFSYPLRTFHVAEDWDGLKALVSSSSLERKEAILWIINNVDVFQGREKRLMELDGGDPYRELERHYFPLLRRVQVKVEYDLQKIIEEHYKVKIEQKDFAAVLEREKRRLGIAVSRPDSLVSTLSGEVAPDHSLELLEDPTLENTAKSDITVHLEGDAPAKQEVSKPSLPGALSPTKELETYLFKPVLGVKTNLLSLLGYSAELKKRYFTPSVEVEYFISAHWSICGEWVYSVTDTKGEDAHVWAPSSLSFEPRYWFFDSDDSHHWLYAGLYVLTGQFDELLKGAQDAGRTGSYNEGGLSLGVYVPFSSRLGLELGARFGYRSVEGKRYSYGASHYYYKDSYSWSGLKATGFRVCVSYRFGRKYSPRK
nr:DUF3575 domain-containing protein [uncultured Bacteroides sp.]